MFRETGHDFDQPTKESLIAVIDKLADFAADYRDQKIIREHYGEIMSLIDKLD